MEPKSWKVSYRQDGLFRENNNAVKTLDGRNHRYLSQKYLSYRPKHPIEDKFRETHFLADIYKLVSSKQENGNWG